MKYLSWYDDTGQGKQEARSRAVMLFQCVFLSRVFPFPCSGLRHDARPREEGERKGSEEVGERRVFWVIPLPPSRVVRFGLSPLSKCWLKTLRCLKALWFVGGLLNGDIVVLVKSKLRSFVVVTETIILKYIPWGSISLLLDDYTLHVDTNMSPVGWCSRMSVGSVSRRMFANLLETVSLSRSGQCYGWSLSNCRYVSFVATRNSSRVIQNNTMPSTTLSSFTCLWCFLVICMTFTIAFP